MLIIRESSIIWKNQIDTQIFVSILKIPDTGYSFPVLFIVLSFPTWISLSAVHAGWEEFSVEAQPKNLLGRQRTRRQKQTCQKFPQFSPTPYQNCVILPTLFNMVKTVAKNLGNAGSCIHNKTKTEQTKSSCLKTVTTSLLKKKLACTLHE